MQWPILLLVAFVFAGMTRSGAAEGIHGNGLVAPASPQLQGFTSLFQSPPLRIAPDSSSPPPPGAPPAATPPRQAPAGPIGTIQAGAMCRPALTAAEVRYGIPAGLLQAIGVVESGRRDERTGQREPWPWSINGEGEPHIFDTKQEAVAWVRQAQARGMRSIDVGCAQINLMYHPNAFASLEEAFDPVSNADYAARFLTELWNTSARGNWMTAAGHYHSQTPELADAYRQQVQAVFAGGTARTSPLLTLVSAHNPVSPLGSAQPTPSPGAPQPQQGRIIPAPAGAIGRGLDAYRAMPIQMALIIPPGRGARGAP